MNHQCPAKSFLITSILILFVVTLSSCNNGNKSHIKTISSAGQLKKITTRAKDRLLMIDLYDETCMSCFYLFPTLEEIAREQKKNVSIYKVNTGKNPEIARSFNITAKPHVVYMKNGREVHAITGVQPKDTFVTVIGKYAR